MKAALVAGEASGDLLAGLLLDGLKAHWSDLQSFGIGGSQMQARGFEPWWSYEKLAVRGYVEVLRHYREIIAIRQKLKEKLLHARPDIFIGVDAPDFNLNLAYQLRIQGIKTVHFISPSIWAWRKERIHQIKKSVDHVLCIFPFEPAIYAPYGVSASYVGHPLARLIPLNPKKDAARNLLSLNYSDVVVAVLPGSRASEIQYLADVFIKTIKLMFIKRQNIKIVIPAIPNFFNIIEQQFKIILSKEQLMQVHLLNGQSHLALEACDVCLVASGTATLEAALYKRPMVIAYKMNYFTWLLMRHKRYQPWVGLPNILLNDFVVPEFLQDQVTPEALAQALNAWLDNPERAYKVEQQFLGLHQELLRDTSNLAAQAIAKVLAQ